MSTFRRRALKRRTFLRGAGVAMSLPFLEAMLPWKGAFADTATMPVRMLAYYVPCGIQMDKWTPAGDGGANYNLSQTLAPLANVKDDLLVLTGLRNNAARPDKGGDHAAGTGAFITAMYPKKSESDIRNGISMDQRAVQALDLGSITKHASLQLGIDGGGNSGGCDTGYSCAYARNISWANATSPVPKTTDTRQAFDFIFGGFDPGETAQEAAKRKAYKKSILDYVQEDAKALQRQLGARDKLKLEQYLDGVNALEKSIDAEQSSAACTVPDRDAPSRDVTAKARVMADLMVAAFECDMTRVASFMLANAGSNRNYQNVSGVTYNGQAFADGHHSISHHQNDAVKRAKLAAIDRWEVTQFAYLLEALKAKRDINGKTLLENSMVFFSSEISDGNRHNHNDMPILLAGSGGGAFTTGRHVKYSGEPEVANLFVSMLNAMGVADTTFGHYGTGPLGQLKI